MKHALCILIQNEPGALLHLAGLFAARHCNIDTVVIVPTSDPSVARMTCTFAGSAAVLEQIVRQARKLIDAIDVSTTQPNAHDDVALALATSP